MAIDTASPVKITALRAGDKYREHPSDDVKVFLDTRPAKGDEDTHSVVGHIETHGEIAGKRVEVIVPNTAEVFPVLTESVLFELTVNAFNAARSYSGLDESTRCLRTRSYARAHLLLGLLAELSGRDGEEIHDAVNDTLIARHEESLAAQD